MAAKTLLSRLCGGAVPLFVDRYYESAIGIPMASCVLAIIAVLMLPIPLVRDRPSCSSFSVADVRLTLAVPSPRSGLFQVRPQDPRRASPCAPAAPSCRT